MLQALVVAFSREGLTYVKNCREFGLSVRVLDCFDVYHPQLSQWYSQELLQAQGRRADVRSVVAREGFDVAIVNDDTDFVRTALITQSLREGGVGRIVVVTKDESKRSLYRRSGAHRIVVADSPQAAWAEINDLLPTMATAG